MHSNVSFGTTTSEVWNERDEDVMIDHISRRKIKREKMTIEKKMHIHKEEKKI